MTIDTKNLRTLSEAATPGPWKFGVSDWNQETNETVAEKPATYKGEGYCDNPGIFSPDGRMIVGCDEYYIFNNAKDAAYLTACSPDVVLALLDALERKNAALDKAVKLLKRAPKITRDIFIGSDFVSWGTHAANLVKELEGEIK